MQAIFVPNAIENILSRNRMFKILRPFEVCQLFFLYLMYFLNNISKVLFSVIGHVILTSSG